MKRTDEDKGVIKIGHVNRSMKPRASIYNSDPYVNTYKTLI